MSECDVLFKLGARLSELFLVKFFVFEPISSSLLLDSLFTFVRMYVEASDGHGYYVIVTCQFDSCFNDFF